LKIASANRWLLTTLQVKAAMYKKILIANDGSEGALKALVEALSLAQSHGAEAHMIYVEESIAWDSKETVSERKTVDEKFLELVAKSEAEANRQGIELMCHMVVGRPAPAIADFLLSRGGFDLLVVGFEAHSALYHRILGKTANRLVELAPCTVVVVK
jgi:nucleotide-binding universal stress UspA family protein